MAKKSSSNAVQKLDKQIKELSANRVDEEKEDVPVISKKDIEEVIKKTPISKSVSKTNTSKKNVRDKIIIADVKKGKVTTKDVTKKTPTKVSKDTTKIEDSNNKIRKLENEMRSLYDTVNDIVEDLDYEKTVIEADDIILNDFITKEKVVETRLDKVNVTFLDRVLMVVFAIFMTLFTAFIGFVIFVSTF